jgi:short-subunit dehydrogenase
MNYFQNKIVFVTGGASGLGEALCECLAKRGAKVILADIDFEKANETANRLCSNGYAVEAIKLDVSDSEAFNFCIQTVIGKYGKLDVLINNAGICIGGEVQDLSIKDWESVLNVNLNGVIYGTTMAYKIMVKQKFGQIVNIASLAGLIPTPMNAPYSASKFAIVGLTNALRREAEEYGIKINLVCPGYLDTSIFNSSQLRNIDKDKYFKEWMPKTISSTEAAKIILNNAEKNKKVIVFPLSEKIQWWFIRLNQESMNILFRRYMRKFRRYKL